MAEIEIRHKSGFKTEAIHHGSGSVIHTDVPRVSGGEGTFFSPTDLLGVALGSCVLTVMAMAAKRQHIPFEGAKVWVKKELGNVPSQSKIILRIHCPHSLEEADRKRLEAAAHQCPVHKHLHHELTQEMIFEWGEG